MVVGCQVSGQVDDWLHEWVSERMGIRRVDEFDRWVGELMNG